MPSSNYPKYIPTNLIHACLTSTSFSSALTQELQSLLTINDQKCAQLSLEISSLTHQIDTITTANLSLNHQMEGLSTTNASLTSQIDTMTAAVASDSQSHLLEQLGEEEDTTLTLTLTWPSPSLHFNLILSLSSTWLLPTAPSILPLTMALTLL